jgi:thioredoxin 1
MSARGCRVSQAHDVRALVWEHWREADVHRALQDSAGRLLLMFGRHGCGSCRQAYARVPLLAIGAVDRLVHLDADHCGGLLREFEVFHLPALFLFRAGRFHAPLHAALAEPGFAQVIERVLAAPAQEAP